MLGTQAISNRLPCDSQYHRICLLSQSSIDTSLRGYRMTSSGEKF